MNGAKEPLVEIRGLRFGWTRKDVLHGIDLDVAPGEALALVGDNGAGKSTLLQLVGAIEPYRGRFSRGRGSLRVLGRDVAKSGAFVRSHVAFVHDRLELPRWMRVRDHLSLVGSLHSSWCAETTLRWLRIFDVDSSWRIDDLSKGQRMLERIAVALGQDARLLVMDEPFSGLDARARRAVQGAIIEELARPEPRGVLFTTHSFADVERCADRVAWLGDGRIADVASVDEWRSRTRSGALEDGPWSAPQEVAA